MRRRERHILIADDSDDDRIMYAHFLSRQGYRISKARDGKEGLAKAFELQPHLILMDLWLPVKSGWDVIKLLRIDIRSKHIPILVVTGHTEVQPPDCDGMLVKPCLLDQLAAEVARLLAAHDHESALSAQLKMTRPPGGKW